MGLSLTMLPNSMSYRFQTVPGRGEYVNLISVSDVPGRGECVNLHHLD